MFCIEELKIYIGNFIQEKFNYTLDSYRIISEDSFKTKEKMFIKAIIKESISLKT